jgi:glycine/D-amino acid oxidase-like deaminating enzyme
MKYDKIILGAGLYGLYSAVFCAKQGDSVLVLEKDATAFSRATHINQARVHNGYQCTGDGGLRFTDEASQNEMAQ